MALAGRRVRLRRARAGARPRGEHDGAGAAREAGVGHRPALAGRAQPAVERARRKACASCWRPISRAAPRAGDARGGAPPRAAAALVAHPAPQRAAGGAVRDARGPPRLLSIRSRAGTCTWASRRSSPGGSRARGRPPSRWPSTTTASSSSRASASSCCRCFKAGLLSPENLLEDVLASLNAAELSKRQFREIARVAGLVFQGYPGQPKSSRSRCRRPAGSSTRSSRAGTRATRCWRRPSARCWSASSSSRASPAAMRRLAASPVVLRADAKAHALRVSAPRRAAAREAHQREARRPRAAHAARVRPRRGGDGRGRAGGALLVTECVVAGERLVLLPERAAWWPAAEDALRRRLPPRQGRELSPRRHPAARGNDDGEHRAAGRRVGRAAGRAPRVPRATSCTARRGGRRRTLVAFAQWRESRPTLAMTLVRGNHDDRAGDPPADWAMRCVDPGEALGPFALVHEPAPVRGGYALAGHIHPAVRLSERGGQSLRLPCFWFGARGGRAAVVRRLHRLRARAAARGRPGLRRRRRRSHPRVANWYQITFACVRHKVI